MLCTDVQEVQIYPKTQTVVLLTSIKVLRRLTVFEFEVKSLEVQGRNDFHVRGEVADHHFTRAGVKNNRQKELIDAHKFICILYNYTTNEHVLASIHLKIERT